MKASVVTLFAIVLTSAAHAQPIVGGSNATAGEFSWIVGIAEKGEADLEFGQLCGGSLIAPNWILTAAHCVVDDYESPVDSALTIADIDVFLNVLKLSDPGSGHERIAVEKIIYHPDYDPYWTDNDIALLKLSSNSSMAEINLPAQSADALYVAGTDATVMGWGITDDSSGESADILQKLNVKVIAQSDCNSSSSYDGDVTSNMFCAGFMNGGKDACEGDSGGPLAVNDNGTWKQIGVVSWGDGCALPDLPGVYTKVANYISWIEAETGLTLNVAEPSSQQSFKAYSKDDQIIVDFLQPQSVPAQLLLNDLCGRLVWQGSATSSTQVDMTDLGHGVYVLSVNSKSGGFSQKFVR